MLADLIELYRSSRVLQSILNFLLFLPVLSVLLPLERFVYPRIMIGTLFLCISAHPTVLLLSNPVLNLIFLLLPITSSHSHGQRLRFDLRLLALYKYLIDIDSSRRGCCRGRFCLYRSGRRRYAITSTVYLHSPRTPWHARVIVICCYRRPQHCGSRRAGAVIWPV